MHPPILGNEERQLYVPPVVLFRKIPAGYAQFFGYPNTSIGSVGKIGLYLAGGSCTSAEVGFYSSVSSGGHSVPHLLLATGTLPEQPPNPGAFTPDTEGTGIQSAVWQFPILRGPEGVEELEEWPLGSEPHLSSLTGPPKHPGDVLEDRWKYVCRDAEGKVLLEGFYRIKVKRLTRPETDGGNVWVPISDTPVPFANGEYETNADNIGAEGEPHSTFHVTVSEISGAVPEGTATITTEIQGGRPVWYEGEGALPTRGGTAEYAVTKVRPHEGRHPVVPSGAAKEWFVAVRPVGGDLVIPFTESGGAADRHKAATELVDDPVVALGGAGAHGEPSPVAFAVSRPVLDALV